MSGQQLRVNLFNFTKFLFKKSALSITDQWRIQDFPEGGA